MDNAVADKSKAFAVRIIRLKQYLVQNAREHVLSNQLLRSGTSIGANVREALRSQSTADFLSKLQIALKEAEETCYWLELLRETDYIDDKMFKSIYDENVELVKLLVSIVKSTKNSNM